MENINLVLGNCGLCGEKLGENDWSDNGLVLGLKCQKCCDTKPEQGVFKASDLEMHYHKMAFPEFLPTQGVSKCAIMISFCGTRVMINGRIGTIVSAEDDCALVKFEDNGNEEYVSGLGSQNLLRLCGEKEEGIVTLPIRLSGSPFLPLRFTIDEYGRKTKVFIDHRDFKKRDYSYNLFLMFMRTANCWIAEKFSKEFGFDPYSSLSDKANGYNFSIGIAYGELLMVKIHYRDIKDYEWMLPDETKPEDIPDPKVAIDEWINVIRTLMHYNWAGEKFHTADERKKCHDLMKKILGVISPNQDFLDQVMKRLKKEEAKHGLRSY